jgi:hypothetical protein
MDLRPPFPADLTPEDEIARFDLLKPRLDEVWQALVDRDEGPSSVVVPSLTLTSPRLPSAGRASTRAAAVPPHSACAIRARMVFITSPGAPFVLEYY